MPTDETSIDPEQVLEDAMKISSLDLIKLMLEDPDPARRKMWEAAFEYRANERQKPIIARKDFVP
ncbi:hypothetical protein [Lacticaseibacillus porcinae]|uniref:hypothetical protein n=1 Tax=Lacticaseibacillus porcinae TaxID=1123687 RepID=UPI000F783868|nr:hypothetical protein [Lacticaseibacillus porcinae]